MAFSYQGLSGLVERPDYDSGFQSLDAFVDGTIGGFDTAAATLTAVGVAAVVPIDAQSVQYAELIGQDTLATRQYLSLLGIRDVALTFTGTASVTTAPASLAATGAGGAAGFRRRWTFQTLGVQ